MKKFVAILLSVCFLLGMLTSCSKIKSEMARVPDDESFFESKDLVLGDEYINDESYSFRQVTPVYYCSDYLYLEIALDNEEYLEKYDYQGTRISKTDLSPLSGGQDYVMSIVMFGDDDRTYLITAESASGTESYINTLYQLSGSDDELTKIDTINMDLSGKAVSIIEAKLVGDEIFVEYQYMENSMYYYGIAVLSTDGECQYCHDIEGNICHLNSNGAGDIIYTEEGNDKRFSLNRFDVDERKIETLSPGDDLIEDYKLGSIGCDGNIYTQKGNKIMMYDPSAGAESEYMDLNYCGAGLYLSASAYIDYIDSDRVILHDLSVVRNEKSGRCKITILQRTQSNPYAGRKIVDVAELWGIQEVLSDGVKKYNENNSDYFAYVDDKYDINVVEIPQVYSDIVTNEDQKTVVNYIINLLIQDISNNEGPDVVIGLGDVTQVNSGSYLMDLNKFIDGADGINRSDYFGNAFSAFSTSDRQYQLPLSIQIAGIMTNTDNAPSNDIGYTFDEYLELVKGPSNGADPLDRAGLGRNSVFDEIFSSMQGDFINQDNEIDIDNEEFRNLAAFVRDNFNDTGNYQTDMSSVMWTQFYDIYYDMIYGNASFQNWSVYGIPSEAGKGPAVTNYDTAAITTCAKDENASWSLIKCMLSEDVQGMQRLSNPININAFDVFANEAIEAANEVRLSQDNSARVLDESDIDRYKTMLLKADTSLFADTEIVLIMNEELQPYYNGEKSIDEVIAVIANRCQLVLDERS